MKMQLWKASTGFIMCQKYQVAPSPLLLSDSGHSVEGSLDNRACWSPLTNTAPSKSVRSLPAEVPSLKSRYCLKLPSMFLPFLRACSQGVGHFPRGWQGRWSGGQVMCGAGHLAQDWLPRRTQGGTGRRGELFWPDFWGRWLWWSFEMSSQCDMAQKPPKLKSVLLQA